MEKQIPKDFEDFIEFHNSEENLEVGEIRMNIIRQIEELKRFEPKDKINEFEKRLFGIDFQEVHGAQIFFEELQTLLEKHSQK